MAEKKLSKKEKAQKKEENKFKVFRGKISIICLPIFVAFMGLYCFTQTLDGKHFLFEISPFLSAGAIVAAALSFRRFSMALLSCGALLADASFITKAYLMETGIGLVVAGLILLIIEEKIRNKRIGSRKIVLKDDFIHTIIFDEGGEDIGDSLTIGSYRETYYKANLYFTLSIITVLACGIGFLLPFGKWAYKYNKGLGFLTSEPVEVPCKRYSEDKPYKDLASSGIFYIEGKCFEMKSMYFGRASLCMLLAFGNIFLSEILSAIIKKPSFFHESETTAGTVGFAISEVIDKSNPEAINALIAYSKNQSEENKQYFVDALLEVNCMINDSIKREGERLDRYEAEKIRSAQAYAVDGDVRTDGQNFYVAGTAEDPEKLQKLEGYDDSTGVGYYYDESGKKVEIKNQN